MALIFVFAYALGIMAAISVGETSLDPSLEGTHLAGLDEERVRLFGSVSQSIMTSFRCFIGDCSTAGGRPIAPLFAEAVGAGCNVVYVFVTMFVGFGLFNIVAAIFVDNTMQVAANDTVRNRKKRYLENLVAAQNAKKLLHWIHRHQQIVDGQDVSIELTFPDLQELRISRDLFESVITDEQTLVILQNIGVAEVDHSGLFDMLDPAADGTIQGSALFEGLMWVRGEMTKSDTISIKLMMRAVLREIHDIRCTLDESQERL